MVPGMTDDQIEALAEVDEAAGQELPEDRQIEITSNI